MLISKRKYVFLNQIFLKKAIIFIQDIIKIVEWILSDGNLPTDEEILKETRSELGFKRSGKKIDDIIRDAIKIVNNKL